MVGFGEVVVAWVAVTAWLGRLAVATEDEMPPWAVCYAVLAAWALFAAIAVALDIAARAAR